MYQGGILCLQGTETLEENEEESMKVYNSYMTLEESILKSMGLLSDAEKE